MNHHVSVSSYLAAESPISGLPTWMRATRYSTILLPRIRSRLIVDGLWVRAFSESGGDEGKAKAIYIVHRVGQLKAEALAAKAAAFQRAQAEAKQERQAAGKLF